MKIVFITMFAGIVAFASGQPATAADATWKEQVLYSFCAQNHCKDGSLPSAGLIDVNGTLYSTTTYGSGNSGTVFALDLATGAETAVYTFCSEYYCADGKYPFAGLLDVNGTLYGTTLFGGTNGGTVFSLDPGTGTETVLHAFGGHGDGRKPWAGLIDVNGVLYGTTIEGGSTGCKNVGCGGALFSVDLVTGTEAVLYSFCSQADCADGAAPYAGLVYANGKLYGTTVNGGAAGYGTIFAFDLKTGTEEVLYSFCSQPNCADGGAPYAGLIDVKGTLYGTTSGTAFAYNLGTGVETTLHTFSGGTDGEYPQASLINVNGLLYGTTYNGGGTSCDGGYGCGIVFSLDPGTGAETVVYTFHGGDGALPAAGLLAVGRKLYGTTSLGGVYGDGTVYVLKQKQ